MAESEGVSEPVLEQIELEDQIAAETAAAPPPAEPDVIEVPKGYLIEMERRVEDAGSAVQNLRKLLAAALCSIGGEGVSITPGHMEVANPRDVIIESGFDGYVHIRLRSKVLKLVK